jgi:SAM-dependent methyltransferase
MLQTGSISVLLSVFELQDAFGVEGDVAEIGVFQGKTLILMAHALNEGERAVAIDIFGKTLGSDRAMQDQLNANLARFDCADACDIVIANSLDLSPADFRAKLGNANVRLFSVDGDHARDAVLHDLALAEAVLAPNGVIAADDLFNEWYPGVTEAFYDFCRAGRDGAHDLEPIAFVAPNGPVETGAGKLLFARAPFVRAYKAGLKLLNQPDLKHCDPFGGFADVPHFCFRDRPVRRPLDPVLRAILDEIVGSPV